MIITPQKTHIVNVSKIRDIVIEPTHFLLCYNDTENIRVSFYEGSYERITNMFRRITLEQMGEKNESNSS